MSVPIIVDLSHHNTITSFAEMYAAGVAGVILKATEGQTFIDKTFASRRKTAMEMGLMTASYHFLKPGAIDAQMSHYLNVVQPTRGERLVLDHEDSNCPLVDLERGIEHLFKKVPQCELTVYSGHLIKEQLRDRKSEPLASLTSLWIAQYTSASAPSWPQGTWPVWSLWQYTDQAPVPGSKYPVDGNRFNGDREQAIAWMGPIPEPLIPERDIVTVAITVPPDIQIVISLNGEQIVAGAV